MKTKHDWRRLDAMTDQQRHAAALADPDAQPLSNADMDRMKLTPRLKIIRRALGLTQEEFSARYKIPLGTLRDWEQGAKKPDRAAYAFLRAIAGDPAGVQRALNAPIRQPVQGRSAHRGIARMTLTIRFKKLRFLAMEMPLALRLSKFAPADADARMLVRHVLIRAENFIGHARQLRKPLNAAGVKTKNFHELTEYYAKEFDEYFHVARDRLSAHVQDLDFGKRIELWNNIEATKASFFADGGIELYRSLENLSVPGYVPYAEFPELSDPGFEEALAAYRASGSTRPRVEMGSDPLAMTRPDSAPVLNTTLIHSRASQIALIHRWMKAQDVLLRRFSGYPNVSRILKARTITDLVSCCDCLITRSVTAGAPQELDGLDSLLGFEGITRNPIEQFKASYNIEAEIAPYRHVRNQLGCHLEDDPSIALETLIDILDDADTHSALSLYNTLRCVFEKTCRQVNFLISYLADGEEIYGVLGAGTGAAIVPFDSTSEGRTIAVLEPPPNSDDEFTQKLDKWLSGSTEDRGYVRSIFYRASLESPVIEQFVWTERQGAGGERHEHHPFRAVHRFLLNRLQSETDASRILGILELMRQCSAGDPNAMTEVLLRFYPTEHSAPYHAAIAYCFGDLADWNNEKVQSFLMLGLMGPFQLAITSRIALLKIFVRTEGLNRITRKTETESFDNALGVLTAGMNAQDRLLCLLLLVSQFCDRRLVDFATVFEKDYDRIRSEIVCLAESLAPEGKASLVRNITQHLVDTHDFVGVALFLNDEFKGSANEGLAKNLVRLACDHLIVANAHDQSRKNLCICFFRLNLFPQALAVAEDLAARNPESADYQILRTLVMAELPDGLQRAQTLAAEVERHYNLSDDQLRVIEGIKTRFIDGGHLDLRQSIDT